MRWKTVLSRTFFFHTTESSLEMKAIKHTLQVTLVLLVFCVNTLRIPVYFRLLAVFSFCHLQMAALIKVWFSLSASTPVNSIIFSNKFKFHIFTAYVSQSYLILSDNIQINNGRNINYYKIPTTKCYVFIPIERFLGRVN